MGRVEKKKPWYMSKTKWAGIVLGASLALSGQYPQAIAAVLGAFGLRDAMEKN